MTAGKGRAGAIGSGAEGIGQVAVSELSEKTRTVANNVRLSNGFAGTWTCIARKPVKRHMIDGRSRRITGRVVAIAAVPSFA